MTTHEIMDDICCINTTAEKAKAVLEYLFNQHSGRRERDKRTNDLSYDTLQTFLSIAFDYINEIFETSHRLCQLKISDIRSEDLIEADSETHAT
jgi:arsenate reductase-like glutaredoxin family protein